MLTIRYQTAFKKDYKRIVRRGYDVRLLEAVITILAEQKPLPEIYRDHNLSGDYIGCREFHITPDSVSYTHLDVYKRQIIFRSVIRCYRSSLHSFWRRKRSLRKTLIRFMD